jgi:uncharacterized protein
VFLPYGRGPGRGGWTPEHPFASETGGWEWSRRPPACLYRGRVRIPQLGQGPRFEQLFRAAAANVEHAAGVLVEILDTFPATPAMHDSMRNAERAGDEITRELYELVQRTVLVPFDREDVSSLATALDDIVDHLDEAADQIVLYGVTSVREDAIEAARLAERTCRLIATAIGSMGDAAAARAALGELRACEDDADRLYRASRARLFGGDLDTLVVIRWKDIYAEIENATDAADRAGRIVESILVKSN